MRFMILVKASKESEAGMMPSEEMLSAMADYHEQLAKAGVLLDGNGLHPIVQGLAVHMVRRQEDFHRRSVHRGEGAGGRLHHDPGEIEGRSAGVDQALSQPGHRRWRDRSAPDVRAGRLHARAKPSSASARWTSASRNSATNAHTRKNRAACRFARPPFDVNTERPAAARRRARSNRTIRRVTMRILGLMQSRPRSEAGAPPSPELMERMGVFIGEVMQAGVLLATDGLHPSAKGKRVKLDERQDHGDRRPVHRSRRSWSPPTRCSRSRHGRGGDVDQALPRSARAKASASCGRSSIRPTSHPASCRPSRSAREQAWRKDMDEKLAKR